MIKIGVISDTHIYAFEDLPGKLRRALADVDLILHAGDLISLAILEGLKKLAPEVHAVCGNMDPPDVKQILPEKKLILVKQIRIGLTHGRGAPFNLMQTVGEKFKNEKLHCIVYGHSHSPRNEVYRGVLYFNPGSPTDKSFAPYNSYGLLEIDEKITGKIIKI